VGGIQLHELLGVLIFLSPLLLTVFAFAANSIMEGIRDLSRKRRIGAERGRVYLVGDGINPEVPQYIQELIEKRRK